MNRRSHNQDHPHRAGDRQRATAIVPGRSVGLPRKSSACGSLVASSPRGVESEMFAALREAGMLLVCLGEAGQVQGASARGEDWLSDLFCHSHMGRSLFVHHAACWGEERSPSHVEASPGVVFVPLPMVSRRRRHGWAVAVIVTSEFLEAEQLSALCQSAGMDEELTRRLLAREAVCSPSEVLRLVKLVGRLHEASGRIGSLEEDMLATGQELAESYEEISLLYTITQSMRVVQQPERFVRMVCEELLGTLPYGWIGVLMSEELGLTEQSVLRQSLAGEFIVFGSLPAGEAELRVLAERLLAEAEPGGPVVLEPGVSGGRYEAFRGLGKAALAHPVSSGEKVLGVIIAGDKLGEDCSASSVDMKLLGATSNHMAIFLENATLYDDLNTMFLGSLEALTASIDAKDRYTCGHSRRVAHVTQELARAVGMDEHGVERMHIAGLVHDVGKIGVPERVLLKPGRLTEEEFGWIRKHPEMGYRILRDIPQLHDILPGVLHHHERWDGRGYPAGLKGEEIPMVARLIGLADAFDAMSSNRTYRSAMDRPSVLEEIERCAGEQFDPELVPHFLKLDFSEFDRLVEEHKAADIGPLDAARMDGGTGIGAERPGSRGAAA